MIRAFSAVALTVALVVYPALQPAPYRRLLVILGVVSALALAMAVSGRWPQAVGWGLAGLLLEYGFSLTAHPGLDPGAPLYGAALLVLGELVGGLAGERVPEGTAQQRFEARRLTTIALVGIAASAGVLIAVWLLGSPGPMGQVVGVAAAGAALVTLVLLVQRRLSPEP